MKLYHTWLNFYLRNAEGNEFLDYNLLPPNYLLHTQKGIFIAWLISGYPGTKESREYFNDIIARFLLGFKEYRPERLSYKPNIAKNEIKNNKVYELKDFQNLPSIQTKKQIYTAESLGTIDQIFWAIKIYTEEMIKELGEGVPVPYQLLEDFALQNFFDRKDKSTLKAKCRNIWHWYNKRSWKMTRRERALKNAETIKNKKRTQILNALTGIFKDDYIKSDGTCNKYKLAKDLGMSKNTIIKHIREMQEEGII